LPDSAARAAEKVFCALFNTLFPDTCRVCETPLKHFSRIPVCPDCLRAPEPIAAEFFCVACRTPFLNRSPLDESGRCSLCRLGLSGFDQVYTFGSYEGPLRKLIQVFKYQGVRPLAPVLGGFLRRALPIQEHFDFIVPMPLHWRRRWSRGFNQSALLAREIARRFDSPVKSILRRVRFTPSQAGLTNAARRANMSGAFRIKSGAQIKGKRVLLIDDVLTTGATAAACARVLKRAGAAHVTLLALARTDRRENLQANPTGRPAKAFAAAAHTEQTA
jgi:ComF family protein